MVSQAAFPPATTNSVAHHELTTRALSLAFELARADVGDPSLMEGLPSETNLTLIPDDDPELAAHAIDAGLTAVRRGENIYFCHVHREAGGTLHIRSDRTDDDIAR